MTRRKKPEITNSEVDSVVGRALVHSGELFPMTPEDVSAAETDEAIKLPPGLTDPHVLFEPRPARTTKRPCVSGDVSQQLGMAARNGSSIAESVRELMNQDRDAAESERYGSSDG